MKTKLSLILLLALLAALGSYVLAEELPVYSPSSLAQYDGLDESPAYIAIDGHVYDVSTVFADGMHAGFEAGKEWTEAMQESGHGTVPLNDLEPIGIFVALELTLEELAQFTGRDDNPAYVAVEGLIYDVTESARWRGGMHNSYRAGRDLTEEIMNASPHGIRVLGNVPLIGLLLSDDEE